MPEYRRVKGSSRTYFFTVVTYNRQQFLCDLESRKMLRSSIEKVRNTHPFRIDAWVLLPEHIHCIWTLPENDFNYSKRWGMIKREFTIRFHSFNKDSIELKKATNSRLKRRESSVWQRRFWEHMIRDQNDFNNHCDYIHYNPVKHSLVEDPRLWPFSTFHRFVKTGLYHSNWGAGISAAVKEMELE
jgi:putative transposase